MAKKVIAVDLGGTHLRVSLVENHKIIKYVKKNTPKRKKDIVNELVLTIKSIITKDVEAICIASPGPLKDGVIKNPPNLPFRNFHIKKYLEKEFKKKVYLENDAICVAIAEEKYGVKKKNFFILTFGTGVGGGIVIGGRLYHGGGYAGELGSIILDDEKTFEKWWQDIRIRYKKKFGNETLVKDLFRINTKESKLFIDEICVCIGEGIGSLINIFDPEVVVLAGGLKESGPRLIKKIKSEVAKYSILPKKTKIQWSKLEHPGTLGASLLADKNHEHNS